jgi:uncharacterized repeat protein (TIGR01451 family)
MSPQRLINALLLLVVLVALGGVGLFGFLLGGGGTQEKPALALSPRFARFKPSGLILGYTARLATDRGSFGPSVNAKQGDVVTFSTYGYALRADAHAVRLLFEIPPGAGPSLTSKATIVADNAARRQQAVVVNSANGQPIVLGRPYDFRVYRNKPERRNPVNFAGSGRELPGYELELPDRRESPSAHQAIVTPLRGGLLRPYFEDAFGLTFKSQVFAAASGNFSLTGQLRVRRFGEKTWRSELQTTAGDTTHYRLLLSNDGRAPARNVIVSLYASGGVTFLPDTAMYRRDSGSLTPLPNTVFPDGDNVGDLLPRHRIAVYFDAKSNFLPAPPTKAAISARIEADNLRTYYLAVQPLLVPAR